MKKLLISISFLLISILCFGLPKYIESQYVSKNIGSDQQSATLTMNPATIHSTFTAQIITEYFQEIKKTSPEWKPTFNNLRVDVVNYKSLKTFNYSTEKNNSVIQVSRLYPLNTAKDKKEFKDLLKNKLDLFFNVKG